MAVCYKSWLTSKGVTQISDFNHGLKRIRGSYWLTVALKPVFGLLWLSTDVNGSSLQSVRASGLMSQERNFWLIFACWVWSCCRVRYYCFSEFPPNFILLHVSCPAYLAGRRRHGDMPSLRGRQHAKHLQTVSVFTKSTDASHCIQRPGTGGMIPNRDQEADIKILFTQPPRIQAELLGTPRMMVILHFTLSFMIEKSFLPVIYQRCSRILPISILLELTVFPPQLLSSPCLHCRTTHWDDSRHVVMRGWGFNSPGRGREVRAVWNCEGVKTYWKLDLNQPKSGGEDQDIPR